MLATAEPTTQTVDVDDIEQHPTERALEPAADWTSLRRVDEASDHPTAERALELAGGWYPTATARVTTMVSEAEAVVLIEVEDQVKILRYENLDADVPRCEICGRAI